MAYKKNRAGSKINKYGVKISAYKQKELRYYVARANKKAKEMLSKYSARRIEEMEKTEEYRGDFIIQEKSANLQNFRSKAQFDLYLKRVKEISTGVYQARQTQRYKDNLIQSLDTKFGSDANELIAKLKQLDRKQIRDFTLADKLHDIGWLYRDPVNDNAKFKTVEKEIERIIKGTKNK